MRDDIDQMFLLLDGILDRKHDVNEQGIDLVLRYFTKCAAPNDRRVRERVKGNCTRLVRKINQADRNGTQPGFSLLAGALERIRTTLERYDRPHSTAST